MKRLDHIATLHDKTDVFFVAFNDDREDPYCGYFATWNNSERLPEIEELKPAALAEIKCNNNFLTDEEKASLYAYHLNVFGADALKDCVKGCKYDIKLRGKDCFAYHLSLACERVLNQSKGN